MKRVRFYFLSVIVATFLLESEIGNLILIGLGLVLLFATLLVTFVGIRLYIASIEGQIHEREFGR